MINIKNKKYLWAITGLLFVLTTINLFIFANKKTDDDDFQFDFNKNYKSYSLVLPTKLNFAGEDVPLHQFDIRESLDRELLLNTYWQSQSILMHKRAHRWFDIITPILKANNIPEDFKYIALIESGFTNVVSPSGAAGFWQFLDKTGSNYGLTVNENVDERYHLEKATQAACNYFKEAYGKFNNWTLVAASYNMGINGVSTQLSTQKVNNYYDLLLSTETYRYVFRILALKEIIENPKRYGFTIRKKDLYPAIPTYKVKVDSSITDLVGFAQNNHCNYKILKLLNPWLRQTTYINKERKNTEFILPKNNFDEVMIDEIYNGISDNDDASRYLYTEKTTKDSIKK